MHDSFQSAALTREDPEEAVGFLSSWPKYEQSVTTDAFCSPLSQWYCFKQLLRKSLKRYLYRGARLALFLLSVGLGVIIAYSVALALFGQSYSSFPQPYVDFSRQARLTGEANLNKEGIFIAANIINAELIRGEWGKSLKELVSLLGPENVFVSIYENDSGTGTKSALEDLRLELPCNKSIVTGAHIDLDEFRQLTLESGETVVRRIEYLAEVRNKALRPLDRPHFEGDEDTKNGLIFTERVFDRLLFINDVFFNPVEAAQLLFSTNRGNYEAACAVDFKSGVNFYDDFATRDADGRKLGYGPGFRLFPWFSSGRSRNDVLAGTDSVRVRSCWGGMVAFKADLFQEQGTDTHGSSLRFRSEPELYWEASECCLIHADITGRRKGGPLGGNGASSIYINPYVRVAYSRTTFEWIWTVARLERGFVPLQWFLTLIFHYPELNERGISIPDQLVTEMVWNGTDIVPGDFEAIRRPASVGNFCGSKGMDVLKPNFQEAVSKGERSFIHLDAPR